MIQSIAFVPDDELLGSGSTEDIKFWDPATGALKHTLKPDSEWYSDDDLSRDTFYLAAKLQCFTAQDWRKSFMPGFLNALKKPSLHDNQWVAIHGQREL